jgi:hypothetical protein
MRVGTLDEFLMRACVGNIIITIISLYTGFDN